MDFGGWTLSKIWRGVGQVGVGLQNPGIPKKVGLFGKRLNSWVLDVKFNILGGKLKKMVAPKARRKIFGQKGWTLGVGLLIFWTKRLDFRGWTPDFWTKRLDFRGWTPKFGHQKGWTKCWRGGRRGGLDFGQNVGGGVGLWILRDRKSGGGVGGGGV